MSVSAIRRLILIGLLLLIGAALSIANPSFMTLDNLMTMLQEASLTGIVAIGFTLILITAGIDMSIGAIIAITSMICVNFISYTQPPPMSTYRSRWRLAVQSAGSMASSSPISSCRSSS